MEFEESIYNLIPKEKYEPPKPKKYKSRHPFDMPPTASTFGLKTTSKPGVANVSGEYIPEGSNHSNKGLGLTFGKPKGAVKPSTNEFQKKGTGTMKLPEGKLPNYHELFFDILLNLFQQNMLENNRYSFNS